MINLTPRLLKTAELITPCKKLADIGTDHAYIPVYALQNDLAETVVASDINEGPLNNAAKTVKQYGFEDRVVLRLSDGLENIEETEASGSALHRTLLERIKKGENSILSERINMENPLTLDEIIAAVNKEDVLCIEIVEEIGQKLGKQIAGLINIFNPELVIIGGTLSLTGDYITQPIKTAVRKYSLNLVNKDSVITTSKLKDKAGIVGACMLARSRMFEGAN